MPALSVVIPTRNRAAEAAEAARAVLCDQSDFELVVVDQSTNGATVDALRELQDEPRLRVVRSSLRGASNARNTGVAATSAPIIAFTDDDCRPAPDWASNVRSVFEREPGAGLMFGRVRLPAKQHVDDYAPSFEPKQRFQRRSVPLPDGDLGIGANFAIRRGVLTALGGFDSLLGPGAPHFRGAEETDLLIRAISRGYLVINAAECDVLHIGLRTGDAVRPLHRAYQLAVGAAFGKHARLSGPSGLRDCLRWFGYYVRKNLDEVLHLRRPQAGALYNFSKGAATSFRYGIDGSKGVFRQR